MYSCNLMRIQRLLSSGLVTADLGKYKVEGFGFCFFNSTEHNFLKSYFYMISTCSNGSNLDACNDNGVRTKGHPKVA